MVPKWVTDLCRCLPKACNSVDRRLSRFTHACRGSGRSEKPADKGLELQESQIAPHNNAPEEACSELFHNLSEECCLCGVGVQRS